MLDQPGATDTLPVENTGDGGVTTPQTKVKMIRPPGWAHRCLRDWLLETRCGSSDAIREAAIDGDRQSTMDLISNPM